MKRLPVRRSVRRRGMSLMEVLIVIVILGVLAALVVPNFFGAQDKAMRDTALAQVRSGLNGSVELFRANCGRYPTTEEGLAALLTKPESEDIAEKWSGPYVKEGQIPLDPWGRQYNYRSPGEYNRETYDLWSSGKNGQSGDDDDVVNWTKS